ncbi:MAG TPA: dTDP-4-dehydrorhamnose 3,5-epimerase [Gemmatimonadaceae bacterium]|nr:dTDP-4-dehydrorhamnose 3,5-epimerase [Gemmatimonadaceae bacterium]
MYGCGRCTDVAVAALRITQPSHARAIRVPGNRGEGSSLPELRVLERQVFRDARGTFAELWRNDEARAAGLPAFVQDNLARSRRGVVRGLHFQNPRPQAKLVTAIDGEIFDVAVDVRAGSPTFGHWAAFTLSGSNGRQLYVPAGFAHGYQTVSDVSVVMYKCSDFYSPDHERAVLWNDDDLAISWPIREPVVSARDSAAPRLRDVRPEWLPSIDQ